MPMHSLRRPPRHLVLPCAIALTMASLDARAQTLHDFPMTVAYTGATPTDSAVRFARALDVQRQLVTELRAEWHASGAQHMPQLRQAIHMVERKTGFEWKGPEPAVLVVPDFGNGFRCSEGQCDGRFEGVRIVTRDSVLADTTVVGVILVAESMRNDPDVWAHELTHAILAQRGLFEASSRHDPKYFGWVEARLLARRP